MPHWRALFRFWGTQNMISTFMWCRHLCHMGHFCDIWYFCGKKGVISCSTPRLCTLPQWFWKISPQKRAKIPFLAGKLIISHFGGKTQTFLAGKSTKYISEISGLCIDKHKSMSSRSRVDFGCGKTAPAWKQKQFLYYKFTAYDRATFMS